MLYHKKGSMEIRKKQLVKILAEGSKSFKQLIESDIFGKNRRDLRACLKQLEKQGVVRRIRKSYKNVQYLLSDSLLSKLLDEDGKEYEIMIKTIKQIRLSNLEEKEAEKLIAQVILRGLRDYLCGVLSVARSSHSFRPYVHELLLNRVIDRFGRILVTIGRKYPKQTDSAIEKVRQKLGV